MELLLLPRLQQVQLLLAAGTVVTPRTILHRPETDVETEIGWPRMGIIVIFLSDGLGEDIIFPHLILHHVQPSFRRKKAVLLCTSYGARRVTNSFIVQFMTFRTLESSNRSDSNSRFSCLKWTLKSPTGLTRLCSVGSNRCDTWFWIFQNIRRRYH